MCASWLERQLCYHVPRRHNSVDAGFQFVGERMIKTALLFGADMHIRRVMSSHSRYPCGNKRTLSTYVCLRLLSRAIYHWTQDLLNVHVKYVRRLLPAITVLVVNVTDGSTLVAAEFHLKNIAICIIADIVIGTESHIDALVSDGEIFHPGYDIHNKYAHTASEFESNTSRHATWYGLPVSDTDFGGFLSDTAVLHFDTDFN